MDNEIRITFKSKKANIGIIRNMVGAMLIEYNPTITFINEVKTVISEAITNSIIHAYDSNEECYIDLVINVSNSKISIDVTDNGHGIPDIELAKEPLYTTKAEEERSGLGFTIMELFCDKLEIESIVDKGTNVHMEKKL
jgi:stage II sporulation protein AB (anti-sigma F factor)